jgi:SAM-dependent methyltransferase
MKSFGQFESNYQQDKNYWGVKPSSVIESQLNRLVTGTVLDLGAGDGRNAIYLAGHGFKVTAVDIAPTGLENIIEKAQNNGVDTFVNTVQADVREFESKERFNNVITNFTLHFLGPDHIIPTLEKMADMTMAGGINLIDDFTQNGPLAAKDPSWYLTPDQLTRFYEDLGWKILYREVRPVKTKAFESPGVPYTQEAIALIAQNQLSSSVS